MSSLVFLRQGFKYEPYLCDGCHNLIQRAIHFNYVAIISVKGSDCRMHFRYMSKDYAINIMKNSHLNEKSGLL